MAQEITHHCTDGAIMFPSQENGAIIITTVIKTTDTATPKIEFKQIRLDVCIKNMLTA